jgi:hypothetical protein
VRHITPIGNALSTSALGQSRPFDRAPLTSGRPPLADLVRIIGMSEKCRGRK